MSAQETALLLMMTAPPLVACGRALAAQEAHQTRRKAGVVECDASMSNYMGVTRTMSKGI